MEDVPLEEPGEDRAIPFLATQVGAYTGFIAIVDYASQQAAPLGGHVQTTPLSPEGTSL